MPVDTLTGLGIAYVALIYIALMHTEGDRFRYLIHQRFSTSPLANFEVLLLYITLDRRVNDVYIRPLPIRHLRRSPRGFRSRMEGVSVQPYRGRFSGVARSGSLDCGEISPV
jgi:hypothetical protein